MLNYLKQQAQSVFKTALAFAPWLVSMYVIYWLEYRGIWTSETAHRGKIAVTILIVGMGFSFLVQSYFVKSNRTR
jgi:hypothetical protein